MECKEQLDISSRLTNEWAGFDIWYDMTLGDSNCKNEFSTQAFIKDE